MATAQRIGLFSMVKANLLIVRPGRSFIHRVVGAEEECRTLKLKTENAFNAHMCLYF